MGRSGPLGRGFVLADGMGLGKTLQTIAVSERRRPRSRLEACHTRRAA
jgi:SNF2 family DNA or RNA helicase